MAHTTSRLTALKVARITEPGMYLDGGGLYLQVTGSGAKSWIYRYMRHRKSREMGLGSLLAVGLADARSRAAVCRRQKLDGIDPIDARKAARGQAALETAKAVTFKEAAESYIEAHKAAWKNAKHAAQWGSTLATYAYPAFGALSVQAIDISLVLKALEPIWTTKPETAGRLRGRMEAILDWAKVRGMRDGENPARWKGHLDMLLPAKSKVRTVKHHAALPYSDLPGFMDTVRAAEGMGAIALEFTILTAARTGETLGATWAEFNLVDEVWIVPAARMKARREHRIPLSKRAVAILRGIRPANINGDEIVFASVSGKRLSDMTMTAVLRRMNRRDIKVHGFRSTFRDWAAERTSYATEVVEMALAHAVGNKVEAAYRRGDLFEKRRRLMTEWSGYCTGKQKTAATILSIGRGSN